MASRESDFATRMAADATLMATLTGGVFRSELVGREGITRETAAGAFDTNLYLKPCALVKQRGLVPDGAIRDEIEQDTSVRQVVEVYLYEDSGYTSIDAAISRLFVLFQGWQFAGASASFPVELVNIIDRQRDEGALKGKSLARVDFAVFSILGG